MCASKLRSGVRVLCVLAVTFFVTAKSYGQACGDGCGTHPDLAGLTCQSGLTNESGTVALLSTSGIPACAAAGTYGVSHASRFDVGGGTTTDITHICIATFSSSIDVVEIFSATASPTQPPGGAPLFQTVNPTVNNVGNVVIVDVAPVATPFQVTGDFWVVVSYNNVTPGTVAQGVATRTGGKAMLRVNQNCSLCTACGAPCAAALPTCQTWVDYDNLNMFQYHNNAPRIRPLLMVQQAFCPPGGQYDQSCCDLICQLDPNCCMSWDPTCGALAAANCPGDCDPIPPVNSYVELESCPLPPPPPPNANNACHIAELVPCDATAIYGTISAHSGVQDEDWYAIDLFDHNATGMVMFHLTVTSESPIDIEVYTGDPGLNCGQNQMLWFSDFVPSCNTVNINGVAMFPPGVNNDRFFIVVRSSVTDNPCGSGKNQYVVQLTSVSNCAFPPNDTCATALPLPCNATTNGSTGAAQPSNPPNCGAASNAAGVWYEIVGSDQQVRIDTCGTADNVNLAVYIGSCGNLNCLVNASIDTIGVCGDPFDSSLEFFGFNGISYYLYVSPQNQQGSFDLNVSCGPINDTCATAEPVVCGSAVSGDTTSASNSGLPICAGLPNVLGDLWYQLVGTGGTVEIDLCDPGTTVNHQINVWTGSCGNLVCVDGSFSDQLGICGGNGLSSLSFTSVAGQDYYIMVHANGSTGPFVMNVNCPTVPNDDCANAVPIVAGITGWDNCAATTDGPPEPCGFTGVPNDDHDLWFTFTMPCDGNWSLEVPPSGFDQALAVYNFCPLAGGALVMCDGQLAGIPVLAGGNGVAGEQFVVRVGGINGMCGPSMIDLIFTCSCPWDIATSVGPGQDGDVNVFDLLELLSNWGTGGPGSGIAPPFNVVDVFDLLDLLANWGPCP